MLEIKLCKRNNDKNMVHVSVLLNWVPLMYSNIATDSTKIENYSEFKCEVVFDEDISDEFEIAAGILVSKMNLQAIAEQGHPRV